jgi:hypothetical protein
MKERPILFSAPMVCAILEDRKTQTRRIVKPQPNVVHAIHNDASIETNLIFRRGDQRIHCPYGQLGNHLWVRETHAIVPRTAYAHSDGVQQAIRPDDDHDAAIYRADWDRSEGGIRWRPSIHMPRWGSRIDLEITGIRCERLKDISDADAIAEGAQKFEALPAIHPFAQDPRWSMEIPISTDECLGSARMAFANFFMKVNGEGLWDANPWVWVIEFKRIKP